MEDLFILAVWSLDAEKWKMEGKLGLIPYESCHFRYEQAYLTSLIGLSSEKYFWIGLSDMEEQGIFKWVTGEGVLYTNWNAAMPGTLLLANDFCLFTYSLDSLHKHL